MRKIRLRLYRILREIGISREKIQTESALKNDLGLDSFDLTCLLFSLETRFNITIPDEDIPKLGTIQQTLLYLNRRIRIS